MLAPLPVNTLIFMFWLKLHLKASVGLRSTFSVVLGLDQRCVYVAAEYLKA
jgi:hypothetical protein